MIDLRKSIFDFEKTLQWKVEDRKQSSNSNPNEIKITFQFLQLDEGGNLLNAINKPITFIVFRQDLKVNCLFQTVEAKFGLSISEEFHQKPEDLYKTVNKFLAFLYCGKLKFETGEYLTLMKLGIHFQCKELVIELLKQYSEQSLEKSSFMSFLIYFWSNNYFDEIDIVLARGFLEKLLLSNLTTLVNHVGYNIERKLVTVRGMNYIELALPKMNFTTFLQCATIYLKNNKKIELTKLVHFLKSYGNPHIVEIEKTYIDLMINQVDEDLLCEIRQFLSDKVISAFENQLSDKANTTVCHFVHSKVCDITNKQFIARCGHKICLNCFFEYFVYKTIKFGEQQAFTEEKYQMKCLSRYIDNSICDEEFRAQDFQQLVPFFNNDQICQYLH